MDKLQSKKKTRQSINPSKDDNETKIESEIEGANIGENITYDVLRLILEYSHIRELTTAAMVCRSWNEAAKKEIKTRIKPQDILYELQSKNPKTQVRKNFTEQLLIKPEISLLFVGKQPESRCPQRSIVNDCLCHRMPRETDCIIVWNYGLVYDNLELEGDLVSSLFLPKIPGVRIKFFTINEPELQEFRTTTHKRSREKMARKLFKISPKEENIKSIILFANQEVDLDTNSQSDDAKQILRAFLSSQQTNKEEQISVWGGVANKLTVCTSVSNGNDCEHRASLAGISICGTGISTWSIVLDRRMKTKVQVEKELSVFREAVKLQKHSVGFMFACCGRGEDWYSEKHVEPKIFRKLFPNVPLVGSFGGGEFGLTTIPQESPKGAGIVHEYSTIFLILTYGSLRNMK